MKTRTFLLPIMLLASIVTMPGAFAKGEQTMTEGVIKKIDASTGKVTIKHGPIENLDMPPMSMVFGVKNTAMLSGLAKGDNVQFFVVDEDGKMIIEELEVAD